jgi:PAS domain S-box-containing protein
VTGRSWPDIAGDLVRDPTGRIADAFARRETWSGETVHWRIAGTDHAVAVDLAGMPVFDRARHFTGFRGFGLCRTDVLSEWLSSSPAEPSPQEPPEAGVAPTPAEAAGYATAVPHGLAAPTEPVASSAGAPHGPVAPSPPLSDETAASPPVASSAGAPHGPVAPGPSVSEETAASPPVASSAGALHGPVAPSPSLSGETAASPPAAAAPARMPVLLPERAAASDTASQTVGEAVMGAATARSVVPITGLRTHVAAHLGAAPVPLRPREEAGAARAEAVRPANDDGELAGSVQPAEPKRLPLLSSEERSAFREIARSLGARFDDEAAEAQLPASEMSNDARVRELAAILDTATDGVIILNDGGRIVSLNRSAEALFGYEQSDVAGESLAVLLAPESQAVTGGYLEGLRESGVAMLLNDGREVLGRVRQGGVIPLFMTIGRLSEEPGRKFCVVLRDMTAVKTAEAELLAAKRVAQEASAYKSDFLTRLGDEVKSPLNAIIGFAELMREERFGPLGNERYRDAVKDIHACARHIGKILDGLLDLAKIEAGCMELSFTGVNLNDLVANCLAEMLQQAARERIVIRTSFAPKMPAVVADERSLRQVVLNIVSNAVKFTNAGGQVIISTAMTDRGEVALRVRDTGVGMTDDEIRTALEPLHQPAQGHGGSGLGLALAKALIEANRGALHITSTPHEGTLVEVLFPPTRVLAE